MDSVEWSEQSYNVKDLAKHFHGHFPLLVKVAQGYYGDFGMEFSIGQVMWIIQLHLIFNSVICIIDFHLISGPCSCTQSCRTGVHNYIFLF